MKTYDWRKDLDQFIPDALSAVAEIDEITDIDWVEDAFPPAHI